MMEIGSSVDFPLKHDSQLIVVDVLKRNLLDWSHDLGDKMQKSIADQKEKMKGLVLKSGNDLRIYPYKRLAGSDRYEVDSKCGISILGENSIHSCEDVLGPNDDEPILNIYFFTELDAS